MSQLLDLIFSTGVNLLRSYFNWLTGDPVLSIILTIGFVALVWTVIDNL